MLKIENLSKSFGQKEVLKDLDLEVQDGSIFGLVGINGAGKSTLLRLIAGVYEPDAGHILFQDEDVTLDPQIRKQIAFVADDQYYPIGSTIRSMKLLYTSMYDFDEDAYQKYLDLFHLDENAGILNLSKGNKRRVALLFAFCIHPRLLLLDEAYDGLEPLARLSVKKALARLIEDDHAIVIISSHNLKELEDICDSFGILEEGKMMQYGDLLASKSLINKYQAAFAKPMTKEDFKDFDLLHFSSEGRVCQLVIRGDREEVTAKLEEMHPLVLDVLQANFEELFIYELESRGEGHE
ncbi:MAG: ABC transporter ATP-binding protein [Lactimicrobium sp.]|jgi:ABC-2 type transport system ATP-binding protein|uniref:ABC transporter ATP-binding protein n=1 Tax=Lactimicrobium sp. TaxID=2563780 RepID=UPI002F35323C